MSNHSFLRLNVTVCLFFAGATVPLEVAFAQFGFKFEGPVKFGEYTPTPNYPPDARQKGEEGSGIAVLTINPMTGRVGNAAIKQSTGSKRLDEAALYQFGHWRFKRGTVTKTEVPFGFWLGRFGGQTNVKARRMDDILAPFLGKGSVVRAPIPQYPPFPTWTSKQGSGVYELHVNNVGRVTKVNVVKSSGDVTFDTVTVNTLAEWRLRIGPKVIELPLAFTLTPGRFKVRIP